MTWNAILIKEAYQKTVSTTFSNCWNLPVIKHWEWWFKKKVVVNYLISVILQFSHWTFQTLLPLQTELSKNNK